MPDAATVEVEALPLKCTMSIQNRWLFKGLCLLAGALGVATMTWLGFVHESLMAADADLKQDVVDKVAEIKVSTNENKDNMTNLKQEYYQSQIRQAKWMGEVNSNLTTISDNVKELKKSR